MHSEIKEIAQKIKVNGGILYLVGGAVRDELLGIEFGNRLHQERVIWMNKKLEELCFL